MNISNPDGKIRVFEPTLREIEHLASLFDEIVWYGYGYAGSPSLLYRTPAVSNVRVKVFRKVVGGETSWKKLAILPGLPGLVVAVGLLFTRYQFIHTRGPSLPAFVAILFSKLFRRKRVWHKYAGNWNESNPPFSYWAQRYLLRHSTHPVTVNGNWNEANPRILAFENPCFSEDELSYAAGLDRTFAMDCIRILFVGRLEREKGLHIVIGAARLLSPGIQWVIVGEGKDKDSIMLEASGLENVQFLGSLNREELNRIYSQSTFLVLPSAASEGFPKVISEACGFGCIPIVSQVSSISQYVTGDFGYLLPATEIPDVTDAVLELTSGLKDLKAMAKKARDFGGLFTYERYVDRIRKEVFKFPS